MLEKTVKFKITAGQNKQKVSFVTETPWRTEMRVQQFTDSPVERTRRTIPRVWTSQTSPKEMLETSAFHCIQTAAQLLLLSDSMFRDLVSDLFFKNSISNVFVHVFNIIVSFNRWNQTSRSRFDSWDPPHAWRCGPSCCGRFGLFLSYKEKNSRMPRRWGLWRCEGIFRASCSFMICVRVIEDRLLRDNFKATQLTSGKHPLADLWP